MTLVHWLSEALHVRLGLCEGVNDCNNEPAVFVPVGLISLQVVLVALALREEHVPQGVVQRASEEHCVVVDKVQYKLQYKQGIRTQFKQSYTENPT